MKNIKDYIIVEEINNNEIKKCAKILAKYFSDKTTNNKSFSLFMNELYHNIDDNNPDELVWELLKNDYENSGWKISRKI